MSPSSSENIEPLQLSPEGQAFIEKARALRPFYFIVVCWGERYTDFLLNFCIAALLSPNNIPALLNRGKNKFLIATTDEDWDRMQTRPIFKLLSEYVEPVKVLIQAPPEGLSACIHMGLGHKLTTQMAFEANAYAVLLTPDLMVSDGTIAAAQRHAVDGIQVVLTAALRFGEEPLFKHLEALGIISADQSYSKNAAPLTGTGRQFVSAGIRSFHSETLRYEWDSPYFSVFPVACWRHVPNTDGILVHCLSWAPLLVDYDAVDNHDSSVMDNWTIDGDYVYRNFGDSSKVYVVQDSDEMMLISWAPLADREQSLSPKKRFKFPIVGNILKGLVLSDTYDSKSFDPLKRKIFFTPVRWHVSDLNDRWSNFEKKTLNMLRKYTDPMFKGRISVANSSVHNLILAASIPIKYAIRAERLFSYFWQGKKRITGLVVRAIFGDPTARERVRRALHFFIYK